MNDDKRYEIKFILDEGKLAEFTQWMYCFTELSPAFETRYVNSLYFDDASYESVRDNLAGVSDRKKTRLRWYHEKDGSPSVISSPVLELKIRNSRLGHKRRTPLPGIKNDLMDLEIGSIYTRVSQEINRLNANHDFLKDYYAPTLHVSYLREYYEGLNGLRVTIDNDINFHSVAPYSRLFEDESASYPMNVVEIKFDPKIKHRVAKLLHNLHLTPKRHSKYLVGLSIFGQVTYI